MKKIFNITFLIVITAISLLFIVNILLGSKVKFFSVVSGSMEPAIKAGSVIFTLKKDNYNQGDVISYRVKDGSVVTHRIVGVNQSDNSEASYVVKGDANNNNDPEPIWGNRVLGSQFLQIPYLGYLSLYLRSLQGLILFVYIPAALLITREIYKIFREIKLKKTSQKNNESNSKRMDNIKRRVIAIIFALTLVIPPSYAYFYDTEIETGNIISTGYWGLIINEVYPNVAAQKGAEGKNDWVELYNPSTEPINLKGYAIVTKMGYFSITTNAVSVPAGGYVLVAHDASTWKLWDIEKQTLTVNLPGNYNKPDWLIASSDYVYLNNPQGHTVDEVTFTDIPAGSSWARYENLWALDESPTPGAQNN